MALKGSAVRIRITPLNKSRSQSGLLAFIGLFVLDYLLSIKISRLGVFGLAWSEN